MNALLASAPVLPTPANSRPAGNVAVSFPDVREHVSALNPAPPVFSCIPAALRVLPFWTRWKYGAMQSNGKRKKQPVSDAGEGVSITAPANWRTFAAVSEQQQARPSYGIGFCVTSENDIIAVDLDSCRDKHTGKLTPAAAAIVRRLPSYWEVSPSGTGLRCFLRGTLPTGHKTRLPNVEVYSRAHFLTVTGKHLPDTPADVCELSEPLAAWYAETFPAPAAAPAPSEPRNNGNVTLNDADLLDRARRSDFNGAKFRALYDDGRADNPSSGDLALCRLLAYWTAKDAARMDSLFRTSALYRDKWDAQHGATTYGERTITKAIKDQPGTFGEREGVVHRKVYTGGGESEPEAAPAAAPRLLPAALDRLNRLERELKQRGVTRNSGLPIFPPGLDYADALDIGRCLQRADKHEQTQKRILWARWYDALPTHKGAKGAILRDLFPENDGVQVRRKQQEFSEWVLIIKQCPADAWNDSARDWTFYEHLAHLHKRPDLQAKYLACKPYKGMYAAMKADYAPDTRPAPPAAAGRARLAREAAAAGLTPDAYLVLALDALNAQSVPCDMSERSDITANTPAPTSADNNPPLCIQIRSDITGDSPDVITLDFDRADAVDFTDLASEAAAAGTTPGALLRDLKRENAEMKRELLHLRRLLNADPAALDTSEPPRPADVEPAPDANLFPAQRELETSEQAAPGVESSSSPPPMQAETVTRPAVTPAPPAMPLEPHRTPGQARPAAFAPDLPADAVSAPSDSVCRALLRRLKSSVQVHIGRLLGDMEAAGYDAADITSGLALLVQQGTVQRQAGRTAHFDTYLCPARC